jgi:hypothetical protein
MKYETYLDTCVQKRKAKSNLGSQRSRPEMLSSEGWKLFCRLLGCVKQPKNMKMKNKMFSFGGFSKLTRATISFSQNAAWNLI